MQGHDSTCLPCRRGQFQMCVNELINGVSRDGGFAEYATIRTEAAVPFPRDLDPAEAAPFLCAGVTVFNGIRQMKIAHGDLVAIQGLGGLGHLAVQYSRAMGYRTVAISRGEDKRVFAKKLGASEYIDTPERRYRDSASGAWRCRADRDDRAQPRSGDSIDLRVKGTRQAPGAGAGWTDPVRLDSNGA